MTSISGTFQDACLGIATAIISCKALPEGVAAAIKSSLSGVDTLRVSLVDKCGDHLLHYPVVESGSSVTGPVAAVAKCKQGTAVWQSFQCSHLLRSDRHPDRLQAFVDWEGLQQLQDAHDCATLPLEAPEGVLGALTVAVPEQALDSDLLTQLKSMAAHLALCLTHVKCKQDLEMAMSVLHRAYPADVINRLLPNSATSGPMMFMEAPTSSDSQFEADGSSISDSSDDCEMVSLRQIALPQWTQAMPYPTGAPFSIAPAEYYKSWIQEFWEPKTNVRCPTYLEKDAYDNGWWCECGVSSSTFQDPGSCNHLAGMHAQGATPTPTPKLPHGSQACELSASQDVCASAAPESSCSYPPLPPMPSLADADREDALHPEQNGVAPVHQVGSRRPHPIPPPISAAPGGHPRGSPDRSNHNHGFHHAAGVSLQQPLPQLHGAVADRGCSADGWGGFRVQCARPGCGAIMHVLPEQLGLEPVTLERIELEPVSRAEVLASDPALLSETLGAPSFKQHWDLTFAKTRLEHKFCAWQQPQLARFDAVHALLLALLSAVSMLWPLCTAGVGLPMLPLCMNGLLLAFGLALLYMSSCWMGYAQHREMLAAAERLVVPPLCLLYSLVHGAAAGSALSISPYKWALGGLVYLALVRRVRWRMHMTLLLPEASTRATAAIAASLCIHEQLLRGLPLLTCFQGVAACVLPAAGLYYLEWQARRSFVQNICKVHID